MIVIGGSSERDQDGMGAFQEYPQVEASRLYSKFSCQPSRIERIPFYIEKVCWFDGQIYTNSLHCTCDGRNSDNWYSWNQPNTS